MFFVFGIITRKEEIDNKSIVVCNNCYSNDICFFMTYSCISLFFIPLTFWKWNIHYYSICNHCQQVFEFADDHFENGTLVQKGEVQKRRCSHCGNIVDSSFEYCPHCGNKL